MPATPMSSSRWSTAGEIKARWRIATDPRRTADEYAVWLHQLLELEGYSARDVDA
jgi:type III pantothenate kinase